MNKLAKGLLTLSLSAAIIGSVACGGNSSDSWKGVNLTDNGNVIENTLGGFVAETDDYLYFINGIGSSSSDNTYGTPIKGALVATAKSDLTKSEVVIPELMVSSDYGAGVYIFTEGEHKYAYYGTPNREKDSTGAVAYSEMTFTKTRLDGKENKKLFTVSSHSVNYRIAQANGTVYIVYYDGDDSALVSYDCSAKKATTIAKTDAENNEATDGVYLSLGDYKFLNNGSGAQVAYTMTVYTQKYYSEQEEQEDSYSRQTANYNLAYLYKAGEGSVCVKNGKADDKTYAIKSNVGDYLFYSETPFGGKEATYAAKVSEIATESVDKKIDYPDNIKDGMIIKSFSKVYYFDSDAKQVIKNTLVIVKTDDDTITEYNTKTPLIKDETISSLIDVDSDNQYIYCFNSDNYIVAIDYDTSRDYGKVIRISERTASSSWYAPEIVEIAGVKYMLYCDSSEVGNSYIHYAKIDFSGDNVKSVNEDDNADEIDYYYIESTFIGKRPAADRAAAAVAKIDEIESPLGVNGEGNAIDTDITAARAAYNALDDDAKACVEDADLAKLQNAEKALDLWKAFAKLKNVLNYANLTNDEKTALTTDYNAAKALLESYGEDASAIRTYLTDNLNYFYQETTAKLSSAE